MSSTTKITYQDVSRINLFFNTNDGSEKIRRLIEQVQSNIDNCDTSKAKWQWIELRARLNSVAEQAADMLENANRRAQEFKKNNCPVS